jgi:hypothetical protein
VTSQHRAVTGRLYQELCYFDNTIFSGEVVEDEETQFLYKDGPGKLLRPQKENMCYYDSINGYYSRGILHCKRSETKMNISIFPKGYYKGINYPVESLSIFGEFRKGINNGNARIMINDKPVCHTQF